MSTDTTIPIPDDIDRIATDIVRADYSKGDQEPDWLLYLAIAKAIHDAVMAERERCETICSDHISFLRKLFQNDVARAIEQVRAEIKAVSA
ncbi:hypothetical protein [Shinella granuli]|uniref:Uncharacterized protein n=1 Tax=Shinella granuli TaxID=323621 RepID=A0A4R2C5E0_SHIGR|nr:hypothetical protein [Shinella granuli]TCN34975.1 hypothetical protein EV665_13156 [Shinella granuli]